MIRKRLNIAFFSILMIAATPRVMTNFNGYADAVYNKAESEWLHFLLTFTQAQEVEKSPATPTPVKEVSTCQLRAAKVVEPANSKPPVVEKKIFRSPRSQVPSSDVALATRLSTRSDVEKKTVAGGMQFEREARRHANRIVTMLDDPAVNERIGRSKTEFLRVLIRSMKLGDGKALRALEREITAVDKAKSPSVASAPADFQWTTDQNCEGETDVAVDETSVVHDSSVDSTLVAY